MHIQYNIHHLTGILNLPSKSTLAEYANHVKPQTGKKITLLSRVVCCIVLRLHIQATRQAHLNFTLHDQTGLMQARNEIN